MLKNYLKIAIAVLLRRKFLTFVNLFATVLTLTVLVCAFAVVESVLSPDGAQSVTSRLLAIDQLTFVSADRDHARDGPLGWQFYKRYIEPLETPDATSFASAPSVGTSYVDGRKVTSQVRRTDAAYWQILRFDVLDGRTIAADDVAEGRAVAVVNEVTARTFFPDGGAVGASIEVDRHVFEIIGVVANEPETSRHAYSDIWVPLTAMDWSITEQSWIGTGNGLALLYFEDPGQRSAAKAEYRTRLATFAYTPNPDEWAIAVSWAQTEIDAIAGRVFPTWPPEDGHPAGSVAKLAAAAVVATLLFMSLPAINMANLNVGRMLERSFEIGLRKAAGASTRVLVGQFVFENVVLAALGGLLAFAIAPAVLGFLNETVFTYGTLRMSLAVFLAGLGFIVAFGVLSGAYPAWKMARLEPAAALRGHAHA